MSHYTDANGKSREIEVTGSGLDRVIDQMGLDLYEVEGLNEAASSTRKFLEVLYILQNSGESPDDWLKAHHGKAGADLIDAGMTALIAFIPSPEIQAFLREGVQKGRTQTVLAVELARVAQGEDPGKLQELLESTLQSEA